VLAIRTYSIPALATADPGFVLQPVDIQELANAWRKVLDGEVAAASRGRDAVKIDAKVIEGPAARTLIDASQKASTLVVGSRGLGGFVGLLLGSVSQQCVTHAHCPVVVIR
jgi:nucleotide-binding universal stress UspA family protein